MLKALRVSLRWAGANGTHRTFSAAASRADGASTVALTRAQVPRYAVAHSCWFLQPDFGMKEHEILCRGTAFFVESRNKYCGRDFHILASGHVTAPHKFPHYFGQDWLQHVRDEHIVNVLDVTDPITSIPVASFLLSRNVLLHPNLDISLLHATFDADDEEKKDVRKVVVGGKEAREGSEEDLLQLFQDNGRPEPLLLSICPEGADLSAESGGESAIFAGFEAYALDQSESGVDVPVPSAIMGNAYVRDLNRGRVYFKTDMPTVFGMCGGPVLAVSKNEDDSMPRVVGMLEGLVPEQEDSNEGASSRSSQESEEDKQKTVTAKKLAGCSSAIDSPILSAFIDAAEEEMVASR